jgi:hypothetical protein
MHRSKVSLFDHFVGVREQCWKEIDPDVSRRFVPDGELKGGGLTEWHFGGIFTIQFAPMPNSRMRDAEVYKFRISLLNRLRVDSFASHNLRLFEANKYSFEGLSWLQSQTFCPVSEC